MKVYQLRTTPCDDPFILHDKFKNRYRIDSCRLKGWNYGNKGYYFITLCIDHRRKLFGKVFETDLPGIKTIEHSKEGDIAIENWSLIPNKFDFIRLHEFVVMPEHMHGLLEVSVATTSNLDFNKEAGGITGSLNPMLHKNIGNVIRWFKGRTTYNIRKFNPRFKWLSGYYDQIIRNDRHLKNVRRYIKNNVNAYPI